MSETYPDFFAARPARLAAFFAMGAPQARGDQGRCGREHTEACGAKPPGCQAAAQLRAERQRGKTMEKALAQYVAPQVLDRMMADPDGLSLGGETREITVLFADIRGFAAMAEGLAAEPQRLIAMVSAVLDPMTDIVLAHGGTLDKYMGDCVMAFWGAPLEDADHARHAFEAAQAMLSSMGEVNRRLRATFAEDLDLREVKIGVGLNTGECVVGNLGSRRRFDYSVLGDPVNVASRLQGLCKAYDAPILIGEATARHLPLDPRLAWIDRILLRGRTAEQGIYGLA